MHAAGMLAGARAQGATGALAEPPELLLQCASLAVRPGGNRRRRTGPLRGLASTLAIGWPYEQALVLEEHARLIDGEPQRARTARGGRRDL